MPKHCAYFLSYVSKKCGVRDYFFWVLPVGNIVIKKRRMNLSCIRWNKQGAKQYAIEKNY